jgi:hypothetical protein
MDDVQKHNICINTPLSQTFRSVVGKIYLQCFSSQARWRTQRLWKHKCNVLRKFRKPVPSQETLSTWDKILAQQSKVQSVLILQRHVKVMWTWLWVILFKITTVIDEETLLLIRHCKEVMRKGFRVEVLSFSLMVRSRMHRGNLNALYHQDKTSSSKMKMLFLSEIEPEKFIFGANEITITVTKLNTRYLLFICRQQFRHIT